HSNTQEQYPHSFTFTAKNKEKHHKPLKVIQRVIPYNSMLYSCQSLRLSLISLEAAAPGFASYRAPGLASGNAPYRIAHSWRAPPADRKSTRLNSSHVKISYAVFCLKKKKKI